jgi:hypothetical protein
MRIYDHRQLKRGDFVFFRYNQEEKNSIDYGIIIGPPHAFGAPVKWLLDPMPGNEEEHVVDIPDMSGQLYIVKRDVKFDGLFL